MKNKLQVHIKNGKGKYRLVHEDDKFGDTLLDKGLNPFLLKFVQNVYWSSSYIGHTKAFFRKNLISENDDCVEVVFDLIPVYD